MAWIITKDHCSDGDPELDKAGKGQWGKEGEQIGQPPMGCFPLRFRLKDDDGNLTHSGRYDPAAVEEDEAWGGLYNALRYGEWDAGSTILEVKADEYVAHAYKDGDAGRHASFIKDSTDKDGWYCPYG